MSDYGIGQSHPHTERVYVKVTAEFDSTGYMQPVAITWSDSRTFPIEKVLEFHPAGMSKEAIQAMYEFDLNALNWHPL